MTRPQISIGDALRAYHHLEPNDRQTALDVLDLLGLSNVEPSVPAPPSRGAFAAAPAPPTVRPRRPRDGDVASTIPGPRPPQRLSDETLTRGVRTATLRRVGTERASVAVPAWHDSSPPLAASTVGPSPAQIPLFSRIHRRGLLGSAIATHVDEGAVDVDTLVEEFCSSLAIRRIPRMSNLTTRRGAQVLVDRGTGLEPYAADQRNVIDALDDILDDDRLEVLDFVGCPSRGVVGRGSSGRVSWAPPPRGTPVMILTDLGIGGPRTDPDRATTEEWVGFVRTARIAGCPLLALVPYHAGRWPPRLMRSMTVLHWSERTTVNQIRHAMRDARMRLKP